MLLVIASICNSIKHSPSPILRDIDTFHVAKICQALPSTEQPDILKIDLAVGTKSVADDSSVCFHFIDACLGLTNFSKGSPPPPPLMYLDDDEVEGL